MKEKIHPTYEFVEVTCACGNKFMTRSTAKNLKLDICSACCAAVSDFHVKSAVDVLEHIADLSAWVDRLSCRSGQLLSHYLGYLLSALFALVKVVVGAVRLYSIVGSHTVIAHGKSEILPLREQIHHSHVLLAAYLVQ